MKQIAIILIVSFLYKEAVSQSVTQTIPQYPDNKGMYLFYLHGAVVTELGNNAINQSVPEWGPYEYLNILDSLNKRGLYIISEQRKKGVHDSIYVAKLVRQIDTLLQSGVKQRNIIVVGASAGWDIALKASALLKKRRISYVIMGGCWSETYKEYVSLRLSGRFLSIYEKSDPHQSCSKLFENKKVKYKEIMLNTGLSHGFIYKGYKEWIDPLIEWYRDSRTTNVEN